MLLFEALRNIGPKTTTCGGVLFWMIYNQWKKNNNALISVMDDKHHMNMSKPLFFKTINFYDSFNNKWYMIVIFVKKTVRF